MTGDRQADRAVLGQCLEGDRGGDADAHLDRRVVPTAGLDPSLEIDEQPHVGRLLDFELLDLERLMAGG